MMNFANYPLRSVHRQWQTLGELNGLQVIDMLTAFELYYRNGDEFLAGPNDNHFNAMVHAGVADLLVETLHPGCLVSRDLH